MRTLAISLTIAASVLSTDAQAQIGPTGGYTFFGYVQCHQGEPGCKQYGPYRTWADALVIFNLSYGQCLGYQQTSQAMLGQGFCEPLIP